MTENYEHYITRNIGAYYKRRLFSPIIYLVILIFIWVVFPLSNILIPPEFTNTDTLESAFEDNREYVQVTFENLTFTGYTTTRFGDTNGYWYYGVKNDECYIALLTPKTCEEGLPTIEKITTNCRIVKDTEVYTNLLTALAEKLEWTSTGITNQLSSFYFSEPDCNPITNNLLFFVYFGSLIYTLISLARYITFIFFPVLAPACQNLIVFGNPRMMLEEAEEELATLPQLATEDMFITEHYFIMTSPYGNAIVPIQEILWIYKHSTLNKILWYHFSISYTLHITTNKRFYLQCPKNIKSDIDGIIDYLAEANHDIIVGFTEENRQKVQERLGKPFHIEKLAALLQKKI